MNYDRAKVDEVVLALMQLTLHGDRRVSRAWKRGSRSCLPRTVCAEPSCSRRTSELANDNGEPGLSFSDPA
jgi:hypothetical protein